MGELRDLGRRQMHCVDRDQPGAEQPERFEPLQRTHAVLRDVVAHLDIRFVHVDVDRHLQLVRERDHLFERMVRHGVGRMRRQAERQT